jgi:alkanesulfonate monooxygenase SsuD/methylene tetrahydromethanopterin reductase-like flavin-dependent oxidoreductase (luciferase family)
VVVEFDQERAREIGRAMISRYLRLVNYRNNLLREGWTEPELSDGGSDHLVDELVLAGTPHEIVQGLRRHLTAGADHVSIQTLGPDPVDGYRALAEILFGSYP